MTKSLITSLNLLSFMHISRRHNKEVDGLSKVVVNEVFGTTFFQEMQEGKILMEGSEMLD